MLRAFAIAFALIQLSCARVDLARQLNTSSDDSTIFGVVELAKGLRINVVDETGVKVSNALVQFGSGPGDPFAGNVLRTDQEGSVNLASQLSHRDWSEIPVTVEAPGYVRVTEFGISGSSHVIMLPRARSKAKVELVGKTTGYGPLKSNGRLDVSLVFPSIPLNELGRLELTSLIAPGVHRVSVYGQELELPENLSVPQQTEAFLGFIPVTLNKPQFRTALPFAGIHSVSAVRAQFEFKPTVSDLIDGKSFFDIINRFDFRSMTRLSLNLKTGIQSYDFQINEVPLVPAVVVSGEQIPENYAMLAFAAHEKESQYTVSDVKRLLNGETRTLASPVVSTLDVRSLRLVRSLKKYQPSRTDFSSSDFEEVSTVISTVISNVKMQTPGSVTAAPTAKFLEFLKPISTSARSLHLDNLNASVWLANTQGRVFLSSVRPVASGALWLVEKNRLWEFRFPGTRSRIDIPAFGADPWRTKGQYRWEQEYSGTDALAAAQEHTHFVRTAVDFSVN